MSTSKSEKFIETLSTTTPEMLIELAAYCTVFESMLHGQNKVVVQQMREVCDKSRIHITMLDNEIYGLNAEINELNKQLNRALR